MIEDNSTHPGSTQHPLGTTNPLVVLKRKITFTNKSNACIECTMICSTYNDMIKSISIGYMIMLVNSQKWVPPMRWLAQ